MMKTENRKEPSHPSSASELICVHRDADILQALVLQCWQPLPLC